MRPRPGWTDGTGRLWLFGGNGGWLNDLWSYDVTAQPWTRVSGSTTINVAGVYGSVGIGASANTPGACFQSVGSQLFVIALRKNRESKFYHWVNGSKNCDSI
jgi:hypothetical protein